MAVGALVVAMTACSGTTSPSSNPPTGTTVQVTLSDFNVVPERSSAAAGSVTFEVVTSGDTHDFSVLRTDLPANALPTGPVDNADITSSDIEVIDSIAPMDSGESATLTLDLSAGNYVLICNVYNHYSLGMTAAFTVN
jgi:uncharacterized cupredoxin-like copper-binding protein